MKQQSPDVHMLDVDSIKIFVHRSRQKEGFERLKQSIQETGLHMPIQVRDISDRPPSERKKPEGGCYKYELICGQGRLTAFQELERKKIPALIVKAEQAEVVGRFLAENMIRKPLAWAEKARLVKQELDSGASVDDVVRKFVITPGHVHKLTRIVSKTAQGLEDEVAAMPMNDAEVFTTLPESDQAIVVEVLRENPDRAIREVLKQAREITEAGTELSKLALTQSLKRVDGELSELRKSLKLIRLHHSLGPSNLQTLLSDRKFKRQLVDAGVNLKRFEEVTK